MRHEVMKVNGEVMPSHLSMSDRKVRVKVRGEVYAFSLKQYRFLCEMMKGQEDIGKICDEVGVGKNEWKRWMNDEEFNKFIEERMREKVINLIWTPDHWLAEMVDVWNGEKKVTKNQIEAGKEIGMRVSPKVEKVQHEFEDVDWVFAAKKSDAS